MTDTQIAALRGHHESSQFSDEWKEVADWLTARRMRKAVAAALKPIMDKHALDVVNGRWALDYRGRLADAAIAAIIPLVRAAERERDAKDARIVELEGALRRIDNLEGIGGPDAEIQCAGQSHIAARLRQRADAASGSAQAVMYDIVRLIEAGAL